MVPSIIDEKYVTLLQSLKPFMGFKALKLAETAEAVLELLATEPAQKATQAFTVLRLGQQKIMPANKEEPGAGESQKGVGI